RVPPRRRRPPSASACVRPHQQRSLQSPPPTLGATGERTDLNRGSSQAPIRSRSAVSGRRRRHNAGKSTYGATCGNRVSRRRPESASLIRRHHQAEDDIEVAGNVSVEGTLFTFGYSFSQNVTVTGGSF